MDDLLALILSGRRCFNNAAEKSSWFTATL
jgi:hypothetical protein